METKIDDNAPATVIVAEVLKACLEQNVMKVAVMENAGSIQVFDKENVVATFSKNSMDSFVAKLKILADLKLSEDGKQSGTFDIKISGVNTKVDVKMEKIDGDYYTVGLQLTKL